MTYPLKAEFSRISKNGNWTPKTYILHQTNLNDIDTALTQFALDLPLKVDAKELYLRRLNNIPMQERIDYQNFVKLIKMLEQNKKAMLLLDHRWRNLFISKTVLKKPNTLFKKHSFSHFVLNKWNFYILDQPIVLKEKEILLDDHDLPTSMTEVHIMDLTNPAEIKAQGLKLEKQVESLKDAVATLRDIAGKSSNENVSLRQNYDFQSNRAVKVNAFLNDHFGHFLKTSAGRIKLIKALVNPKNSKQIKAITQNSLTNLLYMINLISKEDE